jgi:hypothetical protein
MEIAVEELAKYGAFAALRMRTSGERGIQEGSWLRIRRGIRTFATYTSV